MCPWGEHEEDDVDHNDDFLLHENQAPTASGTKKNDAAGNGGIDGDGGVDGDGGMGGRRPRRNTGITSPDYRWWRGE